MRRLRRAGAARYDGKTLTSIGILLARTRAGGACVIGLAGAQLRPDRSAWVSQARSFRE